MWILVSRAVCAVLISSLMAEPRSREWMYVILQLGSEGYSIASSPFSPSPMMPLHLPSLRFSSLLLRHST
jgi:hypothetical protein